MITFVSSLSGKTITLGGTNLVISQALTIDATGLAANVTINANQSSRIFDILGTSDVTLAGLTLSGGRTIAAGVSGAGGAIHSVSTGQLALLESTVSRNSTTGNNAPGGGIWAIGDLTLTQSTVEDNITMGDNSGGGGIYAGGNVVLVQSSVSFNDTAGDGAKGGGVFAAGNVEVVGSSMRLNRTIGSNANGGGIYSQSQVSFRDSTVDFNSTRGDHAGGGGVFAPLAVVLESSTFSNNHTSGSLAPGGGIWTDTVSAVGSTVSGNSTSGSSGHGAGIWASGSVTLIQSTVTNNRATHSSSAVGGVFQAVAGTNFPISISGTILAGNTAAVGEPNLAKAPESTLTANFSLLGTGIAPTAGSSNVFTDDPLLRPLAMNGGPTRTHVPQPASPTIDAGDPSIVFSQTEFDQRGAPHFRLNNGRIDIGAVEARPLLVSTTTDVEDGDYSPGQLSLREAVSLANFGSGIDIIGFAPGLSGATITLTGGEIVITDQLVIDALPLAQNVTINANQASRISTSPQPPATSRSPV